MKFNSDRREVLRHFTLATLAAAPLWASAQSVAPAKKPLKLLVVGDSLSAEYGLQRGEGWVSLLDARLRQQKIDATLVNASISGDTTAGGRSRLPALLAQHKPTLVIIELGGNDALRGLPIAGTRDNLDAMVKASKAAGAAVLLVGMQIPPNYGRKYSEDFSAVFTGIARSEKVAIAPFLLKGIADIADPTSMFQPDRIHPLAKAHPQMLENVWPQLRPLLG